VLLTVDWFGRAEAGLRCCEKIASSTRGDARLSRYQVLLLPTPPTTSPFSHIRSFVCFCKGQQSLMYDRMVPPPPRAAHQTPPDRRALFFCPCHVLMCDHRGSCHEVCRLAYRMMRGSYMTKSGHSVLTGTVVVVVVTD
jgi:hypothetical protein